MIDTKTSPLIIRRVVRTKHIVTWCFKICIIRQSFSVVMPLKDRLYQIYELDCKQSEGILYRSSHRRCSVKKGVLKNFTKFTGKHLCQSLFFNKVPGLRPATLLKKRLCHRCFPVNF